MFLSIPYVPILRFNSPISRFMIYLTWNTISLWLNHQIFICMFIKGEGFETDGSHIQHWVHIKHWVGNANVLKDLGPHNFIVDDPYESVFLYLWYNQIILLLNQVHFCWNNHFCILSSGWKCNWLTNPSLKHYFCYNYSHCTFYWSRNSVGRCFWARTW